ncbi:MAG: TorF family putative porin [Gammaproteobacteria bacterium]
MKRRGRTYASALGALLAAAQVHADVSGSVTMTSDYRFRGISLSAEQPAAEFSLDYDHAKGGYAGAMISTLQFSDQTHRSIGLLAYGGYVRRYGNFNLEGGADYAAFPSNHDYDYPEVYCGITSERASARLYYTRHYFGQTSNTQYLEFNAAQPIRGRLALMGHLGILHTKLNPATTERAYHSDFRIGLALALPGASVQLAWVTAQRVSSEYPVNAAQQRRALILSLTRSF